MEYDVITKPKHYNQPGRKECFEEMADLFGEESLATFCLLNVYKYVYRADYKNGDEDWLKADEYADKYLELGGDAGLLTEAIMKARGGSDE